MDEDAREPGAGSGYRRVYASPKNFDALVIGYYDGPNLIYAARTRNGFTPASRAELFKKIKPLEIAECPFANLPEKKAGLWGRRTDCSEMEEFGCDHTLSGNLNSWSGRKNGHSQHSRFLALRDDKKPKDVRREASEMASDLK
jgi:bifunctional non-homologous end joining protein LigD